MGVRYQRVPVWIERGILTVLDVDSVGARLFELLTREVTILPLIVGQGRFDPAIVPVFILFFKRLPPPVWEKECLPGGYRLLTFNRIRYR